LAIVYLADMGESNKKIAIIGAGIAGLASSVRLACKGYSVDVFESNGYPGGKLSEIFINSFRFDAGPSLFTMPHYVDDLFRLANKEPKDFFQYERLPIVCKYFWQDGTLLNGYAEIEKFAKEVQQKLDVPESKVISFFKRAADKYKITGTTFLEHSLHRSDTWLTKTVGKALFQLPKLDLFTSMHQVHEKLMVEPKMVQLLDRFATYNGSNPYKAPGLLSMIPHFEHGIGAFYPKGGMVAITNAIYNLAVSMGVNFHFNSYVDEILVDEKKVTGLRTKGRAMKFEKVVSNMDVYYTYKKLLPKIQVPKKKLEQERSTSALIFYWGINKVFPELDLHNIFFAKDYKLEFDQLEKGNVTIDPTVYVNISSKRSSDDAPEGMENWFVMINVPYNNDQDWAQLITRIKKNVLAKLSKILNTNIEKCIVVEEILDPRSIESKTSSYQGALYGTSSNNKFAAFMRHANFKRTLQNLYFCGGSVHPGGGIPLCLMSAKIVEDLITDGY